jgi:hypothetical protein
LGERLLCKQEVIGSIPFTSTNLVAWKVGFTTRQEVSYAIWRRWRRFAGLLIER